jgi:SAM-dependent methyltransferase
MKNPDSGIRSDNYRDYVIKDGKFIGAFVEMYQNIDDPWNHGSATAVHYDLILLLLKRYKICNDGGKVLDIGCGKGAFTARIKKALPACSVTGADISPTAIRYAKKTYGSLGIEFIPLDIQDNYLTLKSRYDLVIISQLVRYILPKIREIMDYLIDQVLVQDGYLLISQAFYKPEEQTYGKEIISTVEDLIGFIKVPPIELIESNRLTNHDAILLFQKNKQDS